MALPVWPIATYAPQQDSFQPIERYLDPIVTEMQGGNTRIRARPGDNVGTLAQTVRVSMAEHDTLMAWVKNTIGDGTGRFTMPVWLGSSFTTKVCQFTKGAAGIKVSYVSTEFADVSIALRVYDT